MRKLYIGSDHAGFVLKEFVKHFVNSKKLKHIQLEDVGTYEKVSTHYPDYAEKLAQNMKLEDRGIVICGSGIGIAIAVNKAGVSCATCYNQYMAKECSKHCKVMAVGERVVTPEIMQLMIVEFLIDWVREVEDV